MKASRGPDYFEKLYLANPDPWNFETSAYEHGKYRLTLDLLRGRQFRKGFEIGCSIGVLTKLLAAQCDSLLAVDMVDHALAAAAGRCARLDHVRFEKRQIPKDWPAEDFDLFLFSEVLYFLTPADLAITAALTAKAATADAFVLLVNYTGQIDEPCSGDEAADGFIAAAEGFQQLRQVSRDKFRIDLLTRRI